MTPIAAETPEISSRDSSLRASQKISAPVRLRFVFGVAIFVGAFLLFFVQLLLGKLILPMFGGAPAVWTSCLLVFQVLLLIGYALAHGMEGLLVADLAGGQDDPGHARRVAASRRRLKFRALQSASSSARQSQRPPDAQKPGVRLRDELAVRSGGQRVDGIRADRPDD